MDVDLTGDGIGTGMGSEQGSLLGRGLEPGEGKHILGRVIFNVKFFLKLDGLPLIKVEGTTPC